MMKVIGFLAGVGLTVAAFLLILDTRENRQQETVTATIADPTQEELSAIVAAIAEQVDVGQAEIDSDVQVAQGPEPGTTDTEPQSSFLVANGDGTSQELSELSTAMLAQADGVQAEQDLDVTVPPDQLSATSDDQLQNGFEASSIELEQLSINQVAADESNREDSSDTGTYLFWSPFRSTWAAQGFAGRLTLATQVPVDVVNTGPGKYRVAFSFQDETERLARIERIETITGLKLE